MGGKAAGLEETGALPSRQPTSFVIAHRLSTIRHADLIVVIDHGRIIERGSHAELIAHEGRYWQMLQRQMTSAEDQASAVKEGATGQTVKPR